MPAINPRITITLRPSLHAILKRLSALTGNSQSSIVAELLESSMPVFERMAQMLEAAERLKAEGLKGTEEIRQSLGSAQERLEAQLGLSFDVMDVGTRSLLDQAEQLKRRSRRTAAVVPSSAVESGGREAVSEGSTPVPVTRGSGSPRKALKGMSKGTERRGSRGAV